MRPAFQAIPGEYACGTDWYIPLRYVITWPSELAFAMLKGKGIRKSEKKNKARGFGQRFCGNLDGASDRTERAVSVPAPAKVLGEKKKKERT